MSDAQAIVGVWTVKFKQFTWEYTITSDGRVTWRDPLSGQSGAGRWRVGGKVVNFEWTGSSTRESWDGPISDDNTGWCVSTVGTGSLISTRKVLAVATDEQPMDLPDAPPPEDAMFYPVTQVRNGSKPVYDSQSGAVVGFMYSSGGYFEFYDVSGKFVGSDEIGLEEPLIDPIDFVMIVGGVAKGLGKAAIKAGIRAAASVTSKAIIRGLSEAVVGSLRAAFRTAVSGRALKFTATTAARMSTKGRYVPVHILKLAIRYGVREADEQGAKNAFKYTLQMVKSESSIAPGLNPAKSWAGKAYTLKVVVKEELTTNTILHFHFE